MLTKEGVGHGTRDSAGHALVVAEHDVTGVEVGVVHERGTVRDIVAAVLPPPHTAGRVEKHTVAVVRWLSIVQHERRRHLLDHGRSTELRSLEVAQPLRDVARSRVDAARPRGTVEIARFAETALSRDVPNRSAGYDLARIRAHPRLRHAKR